MAANIQMEYWFLLLLDQQVGRCPIKDRLLLNYLYLILKINLDENSLQLIFVGGIHSSANFTLPRYNQEYQLNDYRNPIKIQVELKNSSITQETIESYQATRYWVDILVTFVEEKQDLLRILMLKRLYILCSLNQELSSMGN